MCIVDAGIPLIEQLARALPARFEREKSQR
jgi:hypothetical protein